MKRINKRRLYTFISFLCFLVFSFIYVYTLNKLNTSKEVLSNIQKHTTVATETQKYSYVDINAKYRGNDLLKLDKEVKKLEYEKNIYNTDSSVFEELIRNYIKGRYNFNGRLKYNTDKIINNVSKYITEDFKESLKSSFKEYSPGNGGATDDFKHSGEIINIYYKEIEKAGTADNAEGAEKYIDTYALQAIVKVRINDSYNAYTAISLTNNIEEKEWKVNSEDIIASEF